MIVIAVAVLAAMAVGAASQRARPAGTDRAVTLGLDFVLWILLPFIGFAFASRLELEVSTILGILCGYAILATVGVAAWLVSARVLGLTRRQQGAVVLATVLANTGYLGLPVSLTLLGQDDFPQAVAWDQLISAPMALLVAPFVAGAFAQVHEELHVGHQLLAILRRAPAIPALVLGLLVPDAWVPQWFLDSATYAVYATLPLGFFAVGATLQRLRVQSSAADDPPPPRQAVLLVIGLRNVLAPALFAATVLVLPEEPRAFMLQAAMPSGINALVVGHAFDLDRGLVATCIAYSTALVLAGALVGGYAF